MSSVPVISHNVIRQALDWMGVPSPFSVRTISNFTFPDGKYQARIDVSWEAAVLLRYYTGVELSSEIDHGLLADLSNCFCSDVFPIHSVIDPKRGIVTVILSCTVRPHD